MEAYILDSLLRRVDVVDKYNSFIWTERRSAYGDFELVVNSTREDKGRLTIGTCLALSESKRVMKILTREDTIDDEGRRVLKLTGRSLEYILDDRVARGTLGDLTYTPKWTLTGTPGYIARKIFHDICVTGILSSYDVIPNVVESSIFPTDNLPEPADSITVEFDPTTVYSAVKQICDAYDLGFRLARSGDSPSLYWDVYVGSDRTSDQAILPAVIFSADMGNLKNSTELSSDALYKNVAYVFSPVGHQFVYDTDVDPDIDGFDRRILVVKADDIKDTDPTAAAELMTRRGRDELAKNRKLTAFDGEISQDSQYKYGVDYNIGDYVEKRNSDGFVTRVQVTENTFASDEQGMRSYPTLTASQYSTPGSWSDPYYNRFWTDFGATEYWADQP